MISIESVPLAFKEGIPAYYIQASSVDRRLLDTENLKGKKILNIGCGEHLFDDVWMAMNGADVTSIDYSDDAVENAKKRLNAASKNDLIKNIKINVELGDGRHLRFADNSFDIVTSYSAIEHMPSPKDRFDAVKEMARVVKKGGIVVITGPNYLNLPVTIISRHAFKRKKRFEYRFMPSELKNMLTSNGLEIEKFDSESVYVIDKRLVISRFPVLRFLPLSVFKPISFMLKLFNSISALKIFGMRMGYKARKPKP